MRNSFTDMRLDLIDLINRSSRGVTTERWQSVATNTETLELMDVNIEVLLRGVEDLAEYRKTIRPSLPWADDHFLERVGGQPINPGVEWRNWPWSNSANTFRNQGRFNHNYMERLWPKFARRTETGELPQGSSGVRRYPMTDRRPKMGIGHAYGDLQDLIELLCAQPYTRQAYIPLFFPEDTGIGDGGRKMCSLGYHFLLRDIRTLTGCQTPLLNVWYPMRSCDFIRHWADDCYLAIRLLLWVLDQCRSIDETNFWKSVRPGVFSMHMTSLHVFPNDFHDGKLKVTR